MRGTSIKNSGLILKIKRPKLLLLIYLIVLHVMLGVLFLYFLDARMAATKPQIKRMAQSYAYERCAIDGQTQADCATLKISEPTLSCADIFCFDGVPHWSIPYEIKGESPAGGPIYLDRAGEPLTSKQVLDY